MTVLLTVLSTLASVLLLGLLWRVCRRRMQARSPHVAVIKITGDIVNDPYAVEAEDPGITTPEIFKDAFEAACAAPGVETIVLEIDSPGGSDTAPHEIAEMIWRYRENGHPWRKKVYAVVPRMAASGGYWVASACEIILVGLLSEIGSIGAIRGRLNVTKVLKWIGLEASLMTTGKFKASNHPLSEESDEARKHEEAQLQAYGKFFVDAVKRGRASKLKNETDLFSGKVWFGQEAVSLGLADGIGSLDTLCQNLGYGEPLAIRYYNDFRRPAKSRFIPRVFTIRHIHKFQPPDLF